MDEDPDETESRRDRDGTEPEPQLPAIEHDGDEPRPLPGVTAPLDDFTEAEQHMQPVGVMPGAGPDVGPEDEAPPAPGTEEEADRARVDRSAIDDDVAEEGED
jgi:hypothetical protein